LPSKLEDIKDKTQRQRWYVFLLGQTLRLLLSSSVRQQGRDRACEKCAAEFSTQSFLGAAHWRYAILVALWAYFLVTESVEVTTLYMESTPAEYLDLILEIPIVLT
jgi:hypothetical protein